VSRHLKTLGDGGWVSARAEGTSRLYRMESSALEPAARRLWSAVRESIAAQAIARHDAARLRAVLAKRRSASEAFFSSAADRWDALRSELFGARTELVALPGLIDDSITPCSQLRGAGSEINRTSSSALASWKPCRSRTESWARHCSC
jgi:ArsR family transcriptional regulator